MSEYSHILAALDFSPAAEQVARRAGALARDFGATLSLLHVFEYLPPLDLADSPLGSAGWAVDQDELLALHRKHMSELAAGLGLEQARQEVIVGLAKTEIIRYAETEGVDLIVVGTHGRHGLSQLLGSTSNAVLHRTPCDVLAVRITE